MVTFNVDSLDFVDDETVRHGAAPDFEWGFDSTDTRFELTDLVNSVTAYVQQNRAGDLVDGRLAQTVAEGKVLADDGVVYDTIQAAENAASSWVKVGPGLFAEAVTIDTAGLTVVGSGLQTVVRATNDQSFLIEANDVSLYDMHVSCDGDEPIEVGTSTYSGIQYYNLLITGSTNQGIRNRSSDSVISNCVFRDNDRAGINCAVQRQIVVGCEVENSGDAVVVSSNGDVLMMNNIIRNCVNGLRTNDDSIALANRILSCSDDGINVSGADNIVANNRVSDSGGSDINDGGSGTVLDANVTGPAN